MPPDSKETELGSSNQEVFLSAAKYTGVVLVPCGTWKCVHATSFGGVDIFEVPVCHLSQQIVLSEGHKNYFKVCVS